MKSSAWVFVFLMFIQSSLFASVKVKTKPQSTKSHLQCVQLKSELKSMAEAQQVIMQTLVNNHDLFVQQLEKYSSSVKLSSKMGEVAQKDLVLNMQSSAEAFRVRAQRGEQTLEKLNKATHDLIARVSNCLR